ncbi:MAG: DUF4423 domain-containing protein [Bdellovibrionaceae bacterium]|nr:DUF4423 domain-containing protein [Pseudobdellovibrionaceae bacterium]
MFDLEDFKVIIRQNLLKNKSPSRGAGARLAKGVGIHSTTLSQILAGTKPLSIEHASLIADYFSFTELESEYFLLLVQLDRAGNQSLVKKLKARIKKIQAETRDLSKILKNESKINLEEQAQFYSDINYSAIRVLSSIEKYDSLEKIADKLSLKRSQVKEMADFLVQIKLCEYQSDRLRPGPNYTHLPAKSPLISKLHSNARIKAMTYHSRLQDSDLCYSLLLSISEEDASKVFTLIKNMVQKLNKIREETEPQRVKLLTVDWIEI